MSNPNLDVRTLVPKHGGRALPVTLPVALAAWNIVPPPERTPRRSTARSEVCWSRRRQVATNIPLRDITDIYFIERSKGRAHFQALNACLAVSPARCTAANEKLLLNHGYGLYQRGGCCEDPCGEPWCRIYVAFFVEKLGAVLLTTPTDDPTPLQARREASLPKVTLIRALQADAIRRRTDRVFDTTSMAVTGRLLEINPEVSTAWNFRREMIVHAEEEEMRGLGSSGEQVTGQSTETAKTHEASTNDSNARSTDSTTPTSFPLSDELTLTEKCLRKHPKSYPAWWHRKWVVARLINSGISQEETKKQALQQELLLSETLLTLDDRNFHGWGYRRFVVSLMNEHSPEKELNYSTKKIENNFSNYSAWHHRTKYLPKVYGDLHGSLPSAILTEEYELVQHAFFTEPEDQAGWMYHAWLTAQTGVAEDATGDGDGDISSNNIPAIPGDSAVYDRESVLCQELSDMEPSCKWPVVTLARLKKLTGRDEESLALLKKLQTIDPMRRDYYCDCAGHR